MRRPIASPWPIRLACRAAMPRSVFGLARTRPLAAGFEHTDSWATDGHKWLQTPYDCGYAIVRDAEAHRDAMTIAASYLPPVSEGERDPTHFVPELSRRARGFATYAMMRHLGRAGIAAMVGRRVELADVGPGAWRSCSERHRAQSDRRALWGRGGGRFAWCLIGHKREAPYSFSVALRAARCSSVYGVLLS
jgi:hypothetical protein